jgi:hypothetical protein
MSYGIDENRVVVSSLINPDGTIAENIENKIVQQKQTVKAEQ